MNTTNIPDCITDVGGETCVGAWSTRRRAPSTNLGQSARPRSAAIPLSDAQDKCVTVVEEVCDPVDALAWGSSSLNTTDVSDCLTEGLSTDQGLGCEFVTGVSSTIDQCISDLCVPPDGGTSDGGAALPASCNNPVTYPPGTTM